MSESLAKKIVKEKAAQTDGIVAELLNLRLELRQPFPAMCPWA